MNRLEPTEAEWQRTVIELARMAGWKVHHTGKAQVRGQWLTPAHADGVGFPDLVLVATRRDIPPPRLLFIELKTNRGRLRTEQHAWGEAITKADHAHAFAWDVWRPRDIDRVRNRLTARHPAGAQP